MDYYRNKLSTSDLYHSKFPSTHQSSQNFEKLLQYLREKYSERLESIQNAQNDFKKEVSLDAALSVMKQSPITEKFLDIRINEIFSSVLLQENEKTISSLQSELAQKQGEILKLSTSLSTSQPKPSHIKSSQNLSSFHFQDLNTREKAEFEKLKEENEFFKKELMKTREIFNENEKLQRYCEQLENDKEKFPGTEVKEMGKMIEAQKVAGIETLKEVQKKFKKKSKLLKRKIIDQKGIIEKLNLEIKDSKGVGSDSRKIEMIKENYEKRENEICERHKQQIISLQGQYQDILESKVKEIEEQINPKLKNLNSDENLNRINKELENQNNHLKSQISCLAHLKIKNEQLEIKNIELENSLLKIKSQLELADYKRKPAEIEKWQQEALLHEETKIHLKKSESKLADLESTKRSLEEKTRKLSESLRSLENHSFQIKPNSKPDEFKLKKLQNQIFLLKSQLSSLKSNLIEGLSSMKSDLHRRLIDLIRSIEKSSDQRSKSLYSENQKMAVLLKNNSEAFDRLQEEVRGEYSKIKLKSQEKLAETLKDVRGKHEKEIEELKNENKKIRDLLDKANSTIMIDTHLNKQLKEEVENLRSEKEVIRKKQLILEEKIQTQTNNFRAQLKNKQQELETLKKSSSFSNS
jgi:hypothetical protein